MYLIRKNGAVSNVLRATLRNSTTGAGLTGLGIASSGLIISTICDNEATATAYTVAGSTIETITTLGTFATPTATKCRFKEVDAVNHPGLYEFQFANARFAVASAKLLRIAVSGAASLILKDLIVQLDSFDLDTAVAQTGDSFARLGAPTGASVSADVASLATLQTTIAGYLDTEVTAIKAKTDQLTFTVAGQIDANVLDWKSATAPAMTGDAFARLGAPVGASISADIAAIAGGAIGPGADSVTVVWTDAISGLPIADGDVWISTDLAGANVVAGTLQTDDDGEATFLLDDGDDYYFWAQKSGQNSINGQLFTAAAD